MSGTREAGAHRTQTSGCKPTEVWLVIAHEATNSGAPRMLLETLRAVRAARGPNWSCEILLDRGGPLVTEFEKLGRVRRLSHRLAEGPGLAARVIRGLIDRPWLKPWRLRRWVRVWQAQGGRVIYSNTATNGRLLAALPDGDIRVVSHVHELAYGLRRFNRPQDLATTLERSDLFFAVSSAVELDLRALGVANEKIRMLPNFLPSMPPAPDRITARREICELLRIDPAARLIMGCGHLDVLKGTDMFVEMARLVSDRTTEPVVFVWLGRDADRAFAQQVRTLAGRQVRFAGEVADAGKFLAASEVIVVTSRVESFSRVALEAGALGRPVLAFAAARGPADLLAPESLVSELSAEAMADAVTRLLREPEEASRQGERLRARIAEDFLAEQWVDRLLSAVEEVSNG